MSALVVEALLDASAADGLFAAAREARSQSAYAHDTVYATVVQFRRNGHVVASTWDTVENMRRRLVHAHAFSRETRTRTCRPDRRPTNRLTAQESLGFSGDVGTTDP